VRIIGHVPSFLIWDVFQIIVDSLSLIVNVCVFNQSHVHWLFSYALYARITMELKLKEEHAMASCMANLMEDDITMVLELFMFVVNIKNKYVMFYIVFFSFLMKYEEKKIHNMLFLMLNQD
jgi:hypothetical protein